jgi:hypothetical protein
MHLTLTNSDKMSANKLFDTDIYSGVKPLHCVAQFVGLAPYSYVRKAKTGEETIDISRSSNVKKIIWAVVLLVMQLIGFFYETVSKILKPPDSLMDLVNNGIQFPFFVATSTAAITFAVTINRKKMLQIVNHLSIVDKFLFHHNNIYKKQNTWLLINVVFTLVPSIAIFYFDRYYYSTYNIMVVITIYLPDFIWSINELQFKNVVEVLRVRLVTLNAKVCMVFAEEYYTGNVSSSLRKRPRRRRTINVSASHIDSSIDAEHHPVFQESASHIDRSIDAQHPHHQVSQESASHIDRNIDAEHLDHQVFQESSHIDRSIGAQHLHCQVSQEYESHIDSIIDAQHLHHRVSQETVHIRNYESKLTSKIFRLRKLYYRLYEICCLINSMYGYMLLQEFTAYTVCLIVDGYNLVCFLVALYRREHPSIPSERYPALILWNVSNLIRPFLICFSCQRVNSEFKRTVNYIQRLKLQPDVSTEVSSQLRLFSIQIQHCKLEFTACGFFDINLSLFCAAVLTATTYITVLVLLEG